MWKQNDRDDFFEENDAEDGYITADEQGDAFFALEEEDTYFDERERADRNKLVMASLLFFSIIIALVLTVLGVRAFNQAGADAVYADKTWVVEGSFKDLTPDLYTKSNVAVYTGVLPADSEINDRLYRSNLGDSVKVSAGQGFEFRGSQVGDARADFPEEVDGLLAIGSSNELLVLRTGERGSLEEITGASVAGTRLKGGLELGLALAVLGAGIFGALRMARRQRELLAAGL